MKKYPWIFIVTILIAVQACQETVDIESEQKAVIEVNEEERDAFFDRNLARLESIWVKDATSKRRFSSSKLDGWNEIRKHYETDINNTERWRAMEDVSASFSNYVVNMYANTALIYHDIHWTGKMLGETVDSKQNRIVHLVKIDGAWKIDLIMQLSVPAAPEEIGVTVKPEGSE